MSIRHSSSHSAVIFNSLQENFLLKDKRFSKFNDSNIPGKNLSNIPIAFLSKGVYNGYFNSLKNNSIYNNLNDKMQQEDILREKLDSNYNKNFSKKKLNINFSNNILKKNNEYESNIKKNTTTNFYSNFINNSNLKDTSNNLQKIHRNSSSLEKNLSTNNLHNTKSNFYNEKSNQFFHARSNSHFFNSSKLCDNTSVKIANGALKIKNKNILGNTFTNLSIFKNSKKNEIENLKLNAKKNYNNSDLISSEPINLTNSGIDIENINLNNNKENSLVDLNSTLLIDNNVLNGNKTLKDLNCMQTYVIHPNLILKIKKKRRKSDETSNDINNYSNSEKSIGKKNEQIFSNELLNKSKEEVIINIEAIRAENESNQDDREANKNYQAEKVDEINEDKESKNNNNNNNKLLNNNKLIKNHRLLNNFKTTAYKLMSSEDESNKQHLSVDDSIEPLNANNNNVNNNKNKSKNEKNLIINKKKLDIHISNNMIYNNDITMNSSQENLYKEKDKSTNNKEKNNSCITSNSGKKTSNLSKEVSKIENVIFYNSINNSKTNINSNNMNNANSTYYSSTKYDKDSDYFSKEIFNSNPKTYTYYENTPMKKINLNLKYKNSNLRDAFTDTKFMDLNSSINDIPIENKNGNFTILDSKTNSMLKISTILRKDILIQDLLNRKYNKTNSFNILSNNNRKILDQNNNKYEKPFQNNIKKGVNNVLNEVYLNIPFQNKQKDSIYNPSELNRSLSNFRDIDKSSNITQLKDFDNFANSEKIKINKSSISIEKLDNEEKGLDNVNKNDNSSNSDKIQKNTLNFVYTKTKNNIINTFNNNGNMIKNNYYNNLGSSTNTKYNAHLHNKDYQISIIEEKETSKFVDNDSDHFDNEKEGENLDNTVSNKRNFSRGKSISIEFNEIRSNPFNNVNTNMIELNNNCKSKFKNRNNINLNSNLIICNNTKLEENADFTRTQRKKKVITELNFNHTEGKEEPDNLSKESLKQEKEIIRDNTKIIELLKKDTNIRKNDISIKLKDSNNIIIDSRKDISNIFKNSGNFILNNNTNLTSKNINKSINNDMNIAIKSQNQINTFEKNINELNFRKDNQCKSNLPIDIGKTSEVESTNTLSSGSSTNKSANQIIKQKINNLNIPFKKEEIYDTLSKANNCDDNFLNNFNNDFIKKSLAKNKSNGSSDNLPNIKKTVFCYMK